MNKQTIRDIDVQGKIILARLDWNLPVDNGVVSDVLRLEATRDTLEYLWTRSCKIIITSHLGRPEGKADPNFSLAPVAQKASEIFGREVKFATDCMGPIAKAAGAALQPGEMLLLENVRFHPEEELNDPAFAAQLVADSGAEIFVYDAFASYRPHASSEGVAHLLPAVAGFLVEQEVNFVTGAIERPNRPLVAVIGGAKVSTKLEILTHLIPKVDAMLLTGPIANTFALAEGTEIGRSVAEQGMDDQVKKLLEIAEKANTQIILPNEFVVSESLDAAKNVRHVPFNGVGPKDYIVDAAPSYAEQLKTAIYDFLDFDGRCTIIWNGPLGITEVPEFQSGSLAMAQAIIATKGTTIVGGGDTASFVDAQGLHDSFTWVSTGGGASLELMSGKGLPCVDALLDK